jgi:hypothetical protein
LKSSSQPIPERVRKPAVRRNRDKTHTNDKNRVAFGSLGVLAAMKKVPKTHHSSQYHGSAGESQPRGVGSPRLISDDRLLYQASDYRLD